MPALNLGQPQPGVFQMAYVVVEVIEMDEPTEATFTRFYAQALTWDGSDPVRPFR